MASFSLFELFRKPGTSSTSGEKGRSRPLENKQPVQAALTAATRRENVNLDQPALMATPLPAVTPETKNPLVFNHLRDDSTSNYRGATAALPVRHGALASRLSLQPDEAQPAPVPTPRRRTKLPAPRAKIFTADLPSAPDPIAAPAAPHATSSPAQPGDTSSPTMEQNTPVEAVWAAIPATPASPFQLANETAPPPTPPAPTPRENGSPRHFYSPFEIVSQQNTPAVIASPFAFNEIDTPAAESAEKEPETIELPIRELLNHAPAGDLYFNPADVSAVAKAHVPAAPLVGKLLTGKRATVTLKTLAQHTDAATAALLRRSRPGLQITVPLQLLLTNLSEARESVPPVAVETVFQTPFSIKAEEDAELSVTAFPYREPGAEAAFPAPAAAESNPLQEEELNPLVQEPFLHIPDDPAPTPSPSSLIREELAEAARNSVRTPEKTPDAPEKPTPAELPAAAMPLPDGAPTAPSSPSPFTSPFDSGFGMPLRPWDEDPIPLESLREAPLAAVSSTPPAAALSPAPALFVEKAATPPEAAPPETTSPTPPPVFSFVEALNSPETSKTAPETSAEEASQIPAPADASLADPPPALASTKAPAPVTPAPSADGLFASPWSTAALFSNAPATPAKPPAAADTALDAVETQAPCPLSTTKPVAPPPLIPASPFAEEPALASPPTPTSSPASPFTTLTAAPPAAEPPRSPFAVVPEAADETAFSHSTPDAPMAPPPVVQPPRAAASSANEVEDLSFGYINDPAQLALRAIFSTDQTLRPEDVVDLTAQFPGLRACLILTPEAAVPTQPPTGDEEVRLFHERARGLFDKTIGLVRELDPDAVEQTFTLRTAKGVISFFAAGEVCLAALHAEPSFQPGVREKLTLVAQSLNQMLRAA